MPIIFTDQFWVLDPYAPPPNGTTLIMNTFTVSDQNSNNVITSAGRDSIDGSDIRYIYNGDTVTVQYPNGSIVTVTGATFYLADGREVFTPTDGSYISNAVLVGTSWTPTPGSVPNPSFGPPACFVPGTLVQTAAGPRAVERLTPGDLIVTADRGAVPLVMTHGRRLSAAELRDNANHRPIRIAAGALGPGLPSRPLVISPQHRMVLRSPIVERMFAQAEIMVPARKLVGQPGIEEMTPSDGIEYIHVILDHHAVIFAEDAPTESLYLGAQVHEQLTERDLARLRIRMDEAAVTMMSPAREFVRGARLTRLLSRHMANNRALVTPAADVQLAKVG